MKFNIGDVLTHKAALAHPIPNENDRLVVVEALARHDQHMNVSYRYLCRAFRSRMGEPLLTLRPAAEFGLSLELVEFAESELDYWIEYTSTWDAQEQARRKP